MGIESEVICVIWESRIRQVSALHRRWGNRRIQEGRKIWRKDYRPRKDSLKYGGSKAGGGMAWHCMALHGIAWHSYVWDEFRDHKQPRHVGIDTGRNLPVPVWPGV